MATYKDLLSEKSFLRVQQRARALMRDGTQLVAILYSEHELIFKTASQTYGKRVMWTQRVSLEDCTLEMIENCKSFKDVETLLKNSKLKVYCDDPSFLYFGYKYLAWKRGYGLEPEHRRPVIRNPHEKGFLCKHLYLVLQLFPFYSKALASKFRTWAIQGTGQVTQNPNFNAASFRNTKKNQNYIKKLTNPNLGPNASKTNTAKVNPNSLGAIAKIGTLDSLRSSSGSNPLNGGTFTQGVTSGVQSGISNAGTFSE